MNDSVAGLISQRYRLGELLGTGGSASVFEAVDTRTGDTVALKILHPHLSQSAKAREAFFVEARAASTLRHPNIAGVLAMGVHDSSGEQLAWIAMQRAEGTSLAELVEANGPLNARQALAVADGVLLALAEAHAHGVMHRDISPANIMVELGGGVAGAGVRSVQVVDFGLADAAGRPALGSDVLRSESDTAAPRGVLGSVNYMSPEQALGLPVDERGDLYQLGAVLYFAVTGRPPFIRDTNAAVMRAHVTAPPPVASVIRPGLDRDLDRMIARALLKDPAARPQTAADFRAQVVALAEVLERGRARPARTSHTQLLGPASNPPRTSRYTAAASTPVQPTGVAEYTAPADSGQRSGGVIWLAAVLTVVAIAVVWLVSSSVTSSSLAAPPAGSTVSATPPVTETPVPTPTSNPSSGSAATVAPTAPATVNVPGLAHDDLAAARASVGALGLTLGTITASDSPLPADAVLASDPVAGVAVAPGTPVNITIASGQNVVPQLATLTQQAAIDAVTAAGFVPVVMLAPSATTFAGTVSSSSPSTGARLLLGASVTIVVAQQPVGSTPPSSTPTAPTPSASATAVTR